MKPESGIPAGPSLALSTWLLLDAETAAAEKHFEEMGLHPYLGQIYTALQVTLHPMARLLLKQELKRMIQASARAEVAEAAL